MDSLKEEATTIFNGILQSINYSILLENETENGFLIKNNFFYTAFVEYISKYKELAISILYDFCVNPKSRINTCIEIINSISYSKNITHDSKNIFLYNVALNSNWFRTQEAAINNLFNIKSYDIIEDLKLKTNNEKLINLINLNSTKITSLDSLFSLFRNKFFK